MPEVTRYLAAQTREDLARKMVFVAGARQVGKTTFARSLPHARAGYLNWDVPADRRFGFRKWSARRFRSTVFAKTSTSATKL